MGDEFDKAVKAAKRHFNGRRLPAADGKLTKEKRRAVGAASLPAERDG
jgi:hypothetical protein